MRQIVMTHANFSDLQKNKGICEIYETDGKSIGISLEDLEETPHAYIYNLFVGSEYINISGHGCLNDPLPDCVLQELTSTWNRF